MLIGFTRVIHAMHQEVVEGYDGLCVQQQRDLFNGLSECEALDTDSGFHKTVSEKIDLRAATFMNSRPLRYQRTESARATHHSSPALLFSAGCINKGGQEQKHGTLCDRQCDRRRSGMITVPANEGKRQRERPVPSRLLFSRTRRPSLSSPSFPLLSSSFSLTAVPNAHINVDTRTRTYPRPVQATAIDYVTVSLQSS